MFSGTIGADIKSMLYTQLHGIKYRAKAYEQFPKYGIAEIPIGKVIITSVYLLITVL